MTLPYLLQVSNKWLGGQRRAPLGGCCDPGDSVVVTVAVNVVVVVTVNVILTAVMIVAGGGGHWPSPWPWSCQGRWA